MLWQFKEGEKYFWLRDLSILAGVGDNWLDIKDEMGHPSTRFKSSFIYEASISYRASVIYKYSDCWKYSPIKCV